MEKDFDKWNAQKKLVQQRAGASFFYAREIWWCYLGVNIGREQDGGIKFARPILILHVFNQDTFLGISLTSRKKQGRYYFSLGTIGGKSASANLSQVRLMDVRRLKNKIGTLDMHIFGSLKEVLRNTILPLKIISPRRNAGDEAEASS